MSYNNKLLSKFNLVGKVNIPDPDSIDKDAMAEMMSDPDYLRQSSALINEALQKGFDVLQLADGDIVMTGTKIITNQYRWSEEEGKLVKVSSKTKKAKAKEEEISEEDA